MTRSPTLTRRLTTVLGTLAAIAASTGAVIGGANLIAGSGDGVAAAPAPLVPVAAMTVDMVGGYTVMRRFTGQIEAAARTDLGFELGGRLIEIVAEEGDLVAQGAVLARLDTSALIPERAALEAELAALAADAELARLTLVRNDALTDRGFRSVAALDDARLALARAEAGMAAIRARIAGVDVRLEKSVLHAPFKARIGMRLADPGQTVAAGQTVLVLFDAAPAQVRVALPPDLAASMMVGERFDVEVGGVAGSATLRHIRPDLDPATRNRSVVMTLDTGLAGQTAVVLGDTVAVFMEQKIASPGFWAPISALREGVRGSWSVMAITSSPDGDRSLPAAVEVIHSDGGRVFLQGQLPVGARIVAQAPDRVAPGQQVLAQAGTDAGE